MNTASEPLRYHPALVTLHWLVALFILGDALIGAGSHIVSRWIGRLGELQIHMIIGASVLAAVLARLTIRLAAPKPPPASAGSRFLDFIGMATHALLYVVVIVVTGEALLSAYQAHMLVYMTGQTPAVRGHFAEHLHSLLVAGLALLIGLHVLAAFFHQFVRRDNLFGRMWYGQREKQQVREN